MESVYSQGLDPQLLDTIKGNKERNSWPYEAQDFQKTYSYDSVALINRNNKVVK